jgi:7-cyano-7-deazaguanine synthase
MSVVNLVSGGLDSTLIAVMMREEGIEQFPLFIDYGQRAAKREWETCQAVHSRHGLPSPVRMDLSGYGAVISTGLTRESLDIRTDAFTPGRNLMFLLMGAAYAHQVQANSIALGLLSEKFSLFPDQRSDFLAQSEATLATALGHSIKIVTPLFEFSKADVVELAKQKGISGTYSCHAGGVTSCGTCISCMEFSNITRS